MTKESIYRYDTFEDGKILHNKSKRHLPAMGWNSWNAFGSGNTEALTKVMADKLVELGLDKLGYKYVVLDDGCYKPERVDGLLSNEEVKFPSGFKSLADYIHAKGLKFGMYNDIGTNLCAGAAVGTCGHEPEDARTYIDWDVDFLKVDNCYYLWDNATFSDPTNAKYVFAPNIKYVKLCKLAKENLSESDILATYNAVDGVLTGERACIKDDYATYIGTFDGTGPDRTPVGAQSSELRFNITVEEAGDYGLIIGYATGQEEGVGSFLQIQVEAVREELIYDDFLEETETPESFVESALIPINLTKGTSTLRLMNHRRQENTLGSYGILVRELTAQAPDRDVILSICEWGKTSPQNWGYKVGDSWRILNDITFQVGSDGDPGVAAWISDYTTSVMAQYNKAVIMDEYAGLDKGWNDPDMMMIGMNGLDETQCRTHMTMWSMMCSPLMLGLDLRRVTLGDWIYNIISNKNMVDINQDTLGIQAKRIYTTIPTTDPDHEYIRDNKRVDVLAKPMSDGSIVLSIINADNENTYRDICVSKSLVMDMIGSKVVDIDSWKSATKYQITNMWTDEAYTTTDDRWGVDSIEPCDNYTIRITPTIK